MVIGYKRLVLLVLACVMSLSHVSVVAQAENKVIYHVNFNDADQQRYTRNHINAVGEENLDLRVILHGEGLTLLLEPDMVANTLFNVGHATDEATAVIAGLKDQGVRFIVCANALRAKQVDHTSDLYDVDDEDIVVSGVAEIARLQRQG